MKRALSKLKHTFIPHTGNENKPHLLRELSIGTILILSTILLLSSFGSSFFINHTTRGVELAAHTLLDLANESRKAAGVPELRYNSLLENAANGKAGDMIANNYFSHEDPSGRAPWYWIENAGYSFIHAGENLALNFREGRDVRRAWLNSPSHKKNLLDTKFKETGIAIQEGIYNNKKTIFIVQMFGSPSPNNTSQGSTTFKTPWYGKLIFDFPLYVTGLYLSILCMLAFSLMAMFFVELERHHYKHIAYGALLFLTLLIFMAINSFFF